MLKHWGAFLFVSPTNGIGASNQHVSKSFPNDLPVKPEEPLCAHCDDQESAKVEAST